MKFTKMEKRELLIYGLVAFAVPYVLGILMWYGYTKEIDVSVFPNAQMLYPAAGAMLAVLLVRKKDVQIPKRFFVTYLVLTVLAIVMSIASIFAPSDTLWLGGVQILLIVGSILCWIFMLTEKKEKRTAYGLRAKNAKSSVFCVVLFIVLYLLRTAIAYVAGGELGTMAEVCSNPTTWITIAVLPINFFLVFIAFFGEEYGWRYYLQPMLQKRFGLRGGVIILGIVWGLWHLPVNFFYYSPGSGLQSAVAQQITCITLGIFFAYAYMKTQNIWVPVILHFLNNNLVPVITADYSQEVLQNNQVTWGSLLPALLLNGIIFGVFIFAKEFRKKEENFNYESEC
ncbi:MAG: type II CAAX endopeptidase family protein [Hespellia sp.]|nr:type II CAAX endopeptidase family protein [Hespellia sp.]